MSFSLEDFIPSPMVEEVKYTAKDRIVINSTTLQIGRDESHIKGQIKQMVLQYLVDKEILSENAFVLAESRAMTGEELLELRHLEYHEKEREREAQLRIKELELSTQVRTKELEV